MARTMRTSQAGLDLIKQFEGFRPRAVALEGSGHVIGYGHTRAARADLRITPSDAEAILRDYDLPPVEEAIRSHVLAPLSQNEFDALAAFVFNIGIERFLSSEVIERLNAGAKLDAAEAMSAWRRARIDGRLIVVDALVRRRAAEQALFLRLPDGPVPVTSAVIRPELDTASAILKPAGQAVEIDTSSGIAVIEEEDAPLPTIERREGESEPEAAARAVSERLTRILGESNDALVQDSAPDSPSVEAITAAVSALAEAEADDDRLSPEAPDGDTPLIDDLEPVDLPEAPPIGVPTGQKVGRVSWGSVLLFALAAFSGALIAAWGFDHLVRPAGQASPPGLEAQLYSGPFAILLGGLIFVIMVYYLMRALFSDG